MHPLQTSIDIAASPTRVWSVLTDFAAYPLWNPFVRSIAGDLVPGAVLRVTVQPEGGKAMSFEPRLLTCQAERELRWKGQVLMPGLFDGEHYFQLAARAPAATLFTHGERFSGLLVPLVLRGTLKRATLAGFEAMNRALKQRAEAMPSIDTNA